jgi:hypothetical protein
MVKYNITVYKGQRLAYFPKKLTEDLGNKLTVLPDSNAAIMWPTGADLRLVAEVVRRVLLPDLELQFGRRGTSNTSSKTNAKPSQAETER